MRKFTMLAGATVIIAVLALSATAFAGDGTKKNPPGVVCSAIQCH